MIVFCSPTAKSPNVVIPVACVLVDVRVPTVGALHDDPLNSSTIKLPVFAPASRSALSKVNVALYVVNVMPPLLRTQ